MILNDAIRPLLCYQAMAEGGPAERSGQVRIGDIVISVGGISIQGLSHEELATLVLGVGF